MHHFPSPTTTPYPQNGESIFRKMDSPLNSIENFALQEIIATKESDAFFPVIDFNGHWIWHKSQDNIPTLIKRLILESNFLDAVKRSKGMPFDIFRGINGAIINKIFPLGNLYYSLNQAPQININKNFSICENARILRDTQTTLGHSNIIFTGNPSNVISRYGTCEGEMLNGLVQKLRETTRSKRLSSATKASKTLTTSWNNGFQRYLHSQIQHNPYLTCIRLELQEQPTNPNVSTVHTAEEQVRSFFTTVVADLSTTVSGYWWKREYRSEIGFSHHAILFCSNGTALQPNEMLASELRKIWHTITLGLGNLYLHSSDPTNYRTWGIGMLRSTSNHLMQSVRRMLTPEHYLRLSSTEHVSPVGMGKLPRQPRQKGLMEHHLHSRNV